MKIEPKAAHSGVVSGALFSGYASTSSAASSELLTVCAAAGVAPGGREVVALVPNKVPRFAATVEVRDALVLPKPRCISFGAAAQLPLIALTASAALSTIGLPPRRAFVGTEKLTKPATVLVAGGSGRTPQLLVALLHARGARAVAAVPAAEREAYETLGAALTVDHGIDGLGMEQAGEVDAVIDTLGREPEPLRLREALGALYVSAAPPPLVSLVEDGLLTVARRAWARREQQQKKHLQKEAAQQEPCVFAALSHEVSDAMVAEAISECLDLIEQGQIAPLAETNDALEIVRMYSEELGWARDEESLGRLGFAARSFWAKAPALRAKPMVRIETPRFFRSPWWSP